MSYRKACIKFKIVFLSGCFCLILNGILLAQPPLYSISGTVLEQETNQPLAGAQVFLIGTTIGVAANSDGSFILKNIPSGIFELSVSFLGYESVCITFNTNSIEPEYNFLLKPTVYELDEVTVRPNLKVWKENFDEFRKNFIGTGPFSGDTKIKNPEILSFDFDPLERTLSASANNALIIENKALGYTINYYLDYFIINYREGSSFFIGRTFFIPMESGRKRINNRWKNNRNKAYYGSFLHFSKALMSQRTEEEGFFARGEKRDSKARYVGETTIPSDIYFSQSDSSTYAFSFINFINVTFRNEQEDESYLKYIWSPLDRNPRTITTFQNSSFTLLEDSVFMDKSGYLYQPNALILDGYWAFERVSDMLPINYIPSEE
ncbi:MAG: carboxypeptidase-like regulatory domain-containing protein [Balneola sp.]